MKKLEGLFGSVAKIRLLRLFIFNTGEVYSTRQAARKVQAELGSVRKAINSLAKIKLLRPRPTVERGRRVGGWIVNQNFAHLQALKIFLLSTTALSNFEIVSRISKAGKLKIAVLAGIFIDEPESRVDMLIVGDKFKQHSLDKAMRSIESDLGREIQYVLLNTEDFRYRLGMGDKLLRDIFDYTHKIILDKTGILAE